MKKDILLLHGAIGAKSQLDNLKTLLAEHYNVHCLEFEGHGNTISTFPYSIDLFKKNVIDYLTENKLKEVFIFGYSMGGYVALQLASEHPQLVNSIFTYGTKFDWNEESSLKEASKLNPAVIEEKFPSFADSLKILHGEENWKIVLHKTAEMMKVMGSRIENKIDFSKINCPCVISWGTKDKMVTKEETIATIEKIKNARFYEFEDQPHPIELIDMPTITNKINELLN